MVIRYFVRIVILIHLMTGYGILCQLLTTYDDFRKQSLEHRYRAVFSVKCLRHLNNNIRFAYTRYRKPYNHEGSSMKLLSPLGRVVLALSTVAACSGALAQEAAIRKNLPRLIPKMPPIDQVSTTPISGLWEVRVGSHILYTDASGQFVIEGQLMDMRSQTNLTQERISAATAVDFSTLPLKDAIITHKNGTGERKLAVFADPNCGYCKHYEPILTKLENTTVYTFVVAVLGASSETAARNITCASDPGKAWSDWMLSGVPAPVADQKCDASAVDRNKAYAIKNAISSTPTTFFPNSVRRAGAMNLEQIVQILNEPAGVARKADAARASAPAKPAARPAG